MCNLYSHTSNRQAILEFVRDVTLVAPSIGNQAPQTGIFPDYAVPIVRNTPEGLELAMVSWGLPSSQKAMPLILTGPAGAEMWLPAPKEGGGHSPATVSRWGLEVVAMGIEADIGEV